jgi:hypothetical protein
MILLLGNSFRIPISFVRCPVVKEANPSNPRQAMMMTSTDGQTRDIDIRINFVFEEIP